MKSNKQSNLLRPVAFFALAAILILTVAFAASGYNDGTDTGDKLPLPEENEAENLPVQALVPEYFDRLTGLPTTQDKTDPGVVGFVLNSTDPLFGVRSSKVTIEIPTEGGSTRLVVHLDKDALPGKIGSLSPTRGYISSLSSAFSELLVSYGSDGRLGGDNSGGFDMSSVPGYSYTEYTTYHYTNADLVTAGIKNLSISDKAGGALPFSFVKYGEEIRHHQRATRLTIPYSDTNTTDLVYSGETGEYALLKNGNASIDLLNGKTLSYKNVFLLLADSITYETSDYTEMLLNTDGGGKGLFLTNGTFLEILWFTNESGELVFSTLDGEMLEVNRGTSYIAVQKSSESKNIGLI